MSWIERRKSSLFGSYNLTELQIDQAYLNITSAATEKLWLYQLSTDCFECPYQLHDVSKDSPLNTGKPVQITVSTKFPIQFRFQTSNSSKYVLPDDKDAVFCETEASFGEFGIYDLIASSDGKCILNTQLEPVNIYLPLVLVAIFYAILGLLLFCKDRVVHKLPIFKKWTRHQNGSSKTIEEKSAPVQKQRLLSLDTFRGLCIIIMIFVNDGGAGYYFFEHATWDGLYVADLVFPWFLWIMGVCIPVSIKSQMRRKVPKMKILQAICIRAVKLVGIGLILASKSGPVVIKELRLPGVLQRFGFCYFVTAVLVLICANEDFVNTKISENKVVRWIQDIVYLWKGWIIALSILALYMLLTYFLNVPGCPRGYLGPGGLALYKDIAKYPNAKECIGGSSGYIDRIILSNKHIFKYPTALYTYDSGIFDPEGILGTLTSIFQVWLGVQAGMTIQIYQKPADRIFRWIIWAVLFGGLGTALCGAKQSGGLIPINKNLWSITYVMVTTCFALILLTFLYVVIDLKKWWSGTPFMEPGKNSILLYVGHSVGNRMLPFHFNYMENKMNSTHFLKLIESLWGTSIWVLAAIYLNKIEYFWTL